MDPGAASRTSAPAPARPSRLGPVKSPRHGTDPIRLQSPRRPRFRQPAFDARAGEKGWQRDADSSLKGRVFLYPPQPAAIPPKAGIPQSPTRRPSQPMYYPTLEQVKAMTRQGNLAPVCRSIHADLETPVSAYLKVARGPYSYLLESVEGGERMGRYSFIGANPYKVIATGPGQPAGEVDPLTLVQAEMSRYQAGPGRRPPRLPRRRRRLSGLRHHPLLRAARPPRPRRPPSRPRIRLYVQRHHPDFRPPPPRHQSSIPRPARRRHRPSLRPSRSPHRRSGQPLSPNP